MEVGQVGFVSDKAVSRFHVSKRCNETVNRLNKTKQERFPDLAAEREAYEAAGRAARKAEERARRKAELETQREREREQQERSYDRIMGVRVLTRAPSLAPATRALTWRAAPRGGAGGQDDVQPRGGGEVRERAGG